MNQNNVDLVSEIKRLNLSKYIKLLGKRDNISEVMNGLDIHVQSSSYGEGFPNVVAESMACGTPCIVTDVGDAALIVGKNGWVVPPKNSIKLAKAIENALEEIGTINWNKRCDDSRSSIRANFDISKMVNLYDKSWKKACRKN